MSNAWGQDRRVGPAPQCAGWHVDPGVVLSRLAIRELDRLATEEFGIPSIVLMENAAVRIAEFAAGVMSRSGAVLVLCGPGNNGGDGLAAARQMVNGGLRVAVVLAGAAEKYRGDAAVNLQIARGMGIATFEAALGDAGGAVDAAIAQFGPGGAGLVVDALLGTGAEAAPREPVRSLIGRANALGQAGARVLSVDIPSGLDADTGQPAGGPEGVVVRATWTVTLVARKSGFQAAAAREYLGEVSVADIGVPRALVERLGTKC